MPDRLIRWLLLRLERHRPCKCGGSFHGDWDAGVVHLESHCLYDTSTLSPVGWHGDTTNPRGDDSDPEGL